MGDLPHTSQWVQFKTHEEERWYRDWYHLCYLDFFFSPLLLKWPIALSFYYLMSFLKIHHWVNLLFRQRLRFWELYIQISQGVKKHWNPSLKSPKTRYYWWNKVIIGLFKGLVVFCARTSNWTQTFRLLVLHWNASLSFFRRGHLSMGFNM